MLKKYEKYKFLFSELVKRDFKKKYKRTILGMIWSVLSPLLNVLVLWLIFSTLYKKDQPHFVIYLFSGTLVMSFYTECTNGCMRALTSNAGIFSKINVPKYLFLFSKSVQSFINFGLTLVIYFVFCVFQHLSFKYALVLIYPIIMMLIFNLSVGMILSALFVFFRDIEYLYGIFMLFLNYLSAIFYPVTIVPEQYQKLFYINPVYVFIKFFRLVMLDTQIPGWQIFALIAFDTAFFLTIGCLMYKKYDHEFLYYL